MAVKPSEVQRQWDEKWRDLGLPGDAPRIDDPRPGARILEPLRPWDADDLANLEEIIGNSDHGTAALLWDVHRQISLRLVAHETGDPVKALVQEQACDDGLWFMAESCAEAYLQQELRRLHALIEERTDCPSA